MKAGPRILFLLLAVLFVTAACRSEISVPEKVSDGMKCGTTCYDLTMETCVPYYCSSEGFCEAAWELRDLLDGTSCDDGDICTVGDVCDQGSCRPGVKVSCQTSLPCKTARCSGDLDEPCIVEDGTEDGTIFCDDGDPCTPEGKCNNGECVASTPIEELTRDDVVCGCSQDADCAPLDSACTAWTCDVWLSTCRPTVLQTEECRTATQCMTIQCGDSNDPATCQTTALPDGTVCDDGNDCTLSHCHAGVCQSASGACDDGNPCTTDRCEELQCINEVVPNGQNCPLVGECAVGQCSNGVCQLIESSTCEALGVVGCSDTGQPCNAGHPCVQGICSANGICDLIDPLTLLAPADCNCGANDCDAYGLCNDGTPRYGCVAQATGSMCSLRVGGCCGDGTVEPEYGEYCDPDVPGASCSKSCEPQAFGLPDFNSSDGNYPAHSDRVDGVGLGSETWIFWANQSQQTDSLVVKRYDPQSGLVRASQGVFEDADLYRLNEGVWDVASNGRDRVAIVAVGPTKEGTLNSMTVQVGLLKSSANAENLRFVWQEVDSFDSELAGGGSIVVDQVAIDIRGNSYWPAESSEGRLCVAWTTRATSEPGFTETSIRGQCFQYDCGMKSNPGSNCSLALLSGDSEALVASEDSEDVSHLAVSIDHASTGWVLFGSTKFVEEPSGALSVEIPYNQRTIVKIAGGTMGQAAAFYSNDVEPAHVDTIPLAEHPRMTCNDMDSEVPLCVLVGYTRLPSPQLNLRRVEPPAFNENTSGQNQLNIPLNGRATSDFQVEFLPASCSFVVGWVAEDCVGEICNANHLTAALVEPNCEGGQLPELWASTVTVTPLEGLVGATRLGGLQLATLSTSDTAGWIAASYILQPGELNRVRAMLFPTTWITAGELEEDTEN